MADTQFKLPLRATPEETAGGLSEERLAELRKLARHLRQHGSVEAAAADLDRSEATYRRSFSTLAGAAGWKSTTPEDFLSGETTRRGPKESGTALESRLAIRVLPEVKDLYQRALRASGMSANDLLAEWSRNYLEARREAKKARRQK